ncbi:Gp49 family protein [Pseudomonas farris]
MSSDQTLEQQITALGLTAPRVTLAQIEALTRSLSFHTYVIPGTTTTVAAAIDAAGFVVALGTSSCVSPANFHEKLGRDAAISKAKTLAADELWKLEGYRLSKNLNQACKAGLLAGLGAYVNEGLGGDQSFVGDVASGFCAELIAPAGRPALLRAHHDGAAEKV